MRDPFSVRVSAATKVGTAVVYRMRYRSVDFAIEALQERGENVSADILRKSTTPALDSSSGMADNAVADFIGLAKRDSVLGLLAQYGARETRFVQKTPIPQSGVVAGFVGEGNAIPVEPITLNMVTLEPFRVAALTVVTSETLHSDSAPEWVTDEISQGIGVAIDDVLIDPSNSGSATEPASIFHGGISVAGSTNAAHDIAQIVSAYPGDLRSAVFVMHPQAAARLALTQNGGVFSFLDVSASNGGRLIGIPVALTPAAPISSDGHFAGIVDAKAIVYALEGFEVALSGQTAVLMSTTPSEPAQMTSMFQSNSVAAKCTVLTNWQTGRPCAAYTTSANW